MIRGSHQQATFHDNDASSENAQAVVEWVMLLAVIIIPIIIAMFEVLAALCKFYSVSSWAISLPFP